MPAPQVADFYAAHWPDFAPPLTEMANQRGMNLTWVNKSTFEDIYFFNIRMGCVGDNMWSNSFKNISVYGMSGPISRTFWLQDQCNNIHFDRVEMRGFDGLIVTGSCAGLRLIACDIEGIEGVGSTGVHLAPETGKKVSGVFISSYFERVEGVAVRCAGVDADSVRGLTITGEYIHGGRSDYFSGNGAEYAFFLINIRGFSINANDLDDWTNGLYIDGTAKDGEIKYNSESRLNTFQSGTAGTGVTITRAIS